MLPGNEQHHQAVGRAMQAAERKQRTLLVPIVYLDVSVWKEDGPRQLICGIKRSDFLNEIQRRIRKDLTCPSHELLDDDGYLKPNVYITVERRHWKMVAPLSEREQCTEA